MTELEKKAYRDGRDAYILDRAMDNPYKGSDLTEDVLLYKEYEDAWYAGWEDEQMGSII